MFAKILTKNEHTLEYAPILVWTTIRLDATIAWRSKTTKWVVVGRKNNERGTYSHKVALQIVQIPANSK